MYLRSGIYGGAASAHPSEPRVSSSYAIPGRGVADNSGTYGGGRPAAAATTAAAPPVGNSTPVSIFVEGDTIGVRRKHAPTARHSSPSSPVAHRNAHFPTGPLSMQYSNEQDSMEKRRRSMQELNEWLLRSRQHEVHAHRGEKYSTTMEKWKRLNHARAPASPHSLGSSRLVGHEADDARREPIRYSLRRAQDVLKEAEAVTSVRLLRAASPRMGNPIETLRPTPSPGPGSYNLPTQF